MSKTKPNIIVPILSSSYEATSSLDDSPFINDIIDHKKRFKNLVLQVINDTAIFSHNVDSLFLNGELFTLVLNNKKFVFEEIKVDNLSDYVDVYLMGIKKTADTYSVIDNGTNIIINFNQAITYDPIEIVSSDFIIKGNIISR